MMNRRDFLGAAAAAPLAAQEGPIRIAFLGASHSHAAAKVQVVRENRDFELAGIAEDDPALRERYAKAGVRLLARDAVLRDPAIRVVAVESAVKDHAADARAALEAGKHVHVEKPPAVAVKDLRALVALAAEKKLLLQPGYMWRQHPGINAVLDAARKGWLGEVFQVRCTIGTQIPASQRRELAQFRGGQMFELGCHLIDPMVRLMGKPNKVTPVLKHDGAEPDGLADNTAAIFEFPRALGLVVSASLQPGANRHRAFEVFGSNGSAVVRPIEPAALQVDLVKAAGPYKAGVQMVELAPYQRYVGDFVELARAVAQGGPLAVTAEEEIRVHEALLAASGM